MKDLRIVTAVSTILLGLSVTAQADSDFNWSGMYTGVHAGAGHQSSNFSDDGAEATLINCCFLVGGYTSAGAQDATDSGALGGVQYGGMYQLERLVFGFDIDLSKSDFHSSPGQSWTPNGESEAVGTERLNITTRWVASQALSLGYAKSRWLVFGKAGLAEASNRYALSVTGTGDAYGADRGSPITFAASSSGTLVGPTVGAGVKWAVGDHMFVNAEYDFMDFGSDSNHFSGTFGSYGTGALNTTVNQNISVLKVGLNYLF
jgi:outer membrane immunogenic protein